VREDEKSNLKFLITDGEACVTDALVGARGWWKRRGMAPSQTYTLRINRSWQNAGLRIASCLYIHLYLHLAGLAVLLNCRPELAHAL
jgi:hypothetical protein